MKSVAVFTTLVLLIVGATGTARAWEEDTEWRLVSDRLYYNLGGYIADFSTEAAAGSGNLLGTVIRLEDDLGVDESKETYRFEGFLRLGDSGRHAISFGSLSINRTGQSVLDEQIEFEGVTYDVGAELRSKFNVDLFSIGWRYSLFNTERGEAGVSAGLSNYRFDLGLSGEASIVDEDGNDLFREFRAAETDFIAPIPTVGIFVIYNFTRRVVFRARANLLNAEIGDITARLVDTGITVDWFFLRHVGIGGGLSATQMEYKNRGENPVSASYRQSGFVFYASFAF